MKHRPWILLVATGILAAAAGCGHLDLTPESDPERVITGTVNVRMNLIPPPDSELVVRIVQPPDVTATPTSAAGDLVIGQRGVRTVPERVVAQQVVRAPAAMPAPYRVEFRASDAQLRRGLNIEARISWGGRLRFRNVEAQLVTSAAADKPVTIWLEPVQ